MKKIILFLLCALSLSANTHFAQNFYKYDSIFQNISEKYNVPFVLLKAIALSENQEFNPNIKSSNKNKTYDYGLMQINSIWLKEFKLSENAILRPIHNIEASAKILRNIIDKEGYSWDTIGKYHSANKELKAKWVNRVKQNLVYIIKHDNKYKYVLKKDKNKIFNS